MRISTWSIAHYGRFVTCGFRFGTLPVEVVLNAAKALSRQMWSMQAPCPYAE